MKRRKTDRHRTGIKCLNCGREITYTVVNGSIFVVCDCPKKNRKRDQVALMVTSGN